MSLVMMSQSERTLEMVTTVTDWEEQQLEVESDRGSTSESKSPLIDM
jgi:hypothetical protein